MLYKKTVNQILKQARQSKHLSQAEVARYSSLTQNDLSNFENDKKDIRLSTLERIAAALDMVILPIPKDKMNVIGPLLFNQDEETIEKPRTLLDEYGVSDDE
jgi:transcriptional regulator with XRE-family HTH domain